MMKRHKASLHVGAGAHLFSGADQDPYPAGIHAIEQHFLVGIGVGVMDEGDLRVRNAGLDAALIGSRRRR